MIQIKNPKLYKWTDIDYHNNYSFIVQQSKLAQSVIYNFLKDILVDHIDCEVSGLVQSNIKLRVDFIVYYTNDVILPVEVNGSQHFGYSEFFNDLESYKIQNLHLMQKEQAGLEKYGKFLNINDLLFNEYKDNMTSYAKKYFHNINKQYELILSSIKNNNCLELTKAILKAKTGGISNFNIKNKNRKPEYAYRFCKDTNVDNFMIRMIQDISCDKLI